MHWLNLAGSILSGRCGARFAPMVVIDNVARLGRHAARTHG
jgi:hypothetical protein